VEGAPDPTALHPVSGQERVVLLRPLVTDPRIEVGEYTYYDDPDDPLAFEQKAFLYAHGAERTMDLVMGAPSHGDTAATTTRTWSVCCAPPGGTGPWSS
jgi:hypothetical protein